MSGKQKKVLEIKVGDEVMERDDVGCYVNRSVDGISVEDILYSVEEVDIDYEDRLPICKVRRGENPSQFFETVDLITVEQLYEFFKKEMEK